jgi:hypothetical protein
MVSVEGRAAHAGELMMREAVLARREREGRVDKSPKPKKSLRSYQTRTAIILLNIKLFSVQITKVNWGARKSTSIRIRNPPPSLFSAQHPSNRATRAIGALRYHGEHTIN